MEVNGIVTVINPIQIVTDKFKKQEFVVKTDEQYPQEILMEFNQDKCSKLDSVAVGDTVKVSINLRGRSWVDKEGQTKYFNTIQAWNIEVTAKGTF